MLTTVKSRLFNGLLQLKNNLSGTVGWTVGRESELILIDPEKGTISYTAPEVLKALEGENLTYESGTGTVEINFTFGKLEDKMISKWERELFDLVCKIQNVGKTKTYPLMVGIPPSATEEDITISRLTPNSRLFLLEDKWLKALDTYKRRFKETPTICGIAPKSTAIASVIHAYQLHISLPEDPIEAAKTWNATILSVPLVLSAFVGTPLFLGEPGRIDELRIEVWEILDDLREGRVFFGPGFVDSAEEVFKHYIENIPFMDGINSEEELRSLSDFDLLKRHIKNMWPWIRLVPDKTNWRIEIRCFSALSPMNESLLSYITFGLISYFEKLDVKNILSFKNCLGNFKSAVNQGLTSTFKWTNCDIRNPAELLLELLPHIEEELILRGSPLPTYLKESFVDRLRNRVTPARALRRHRQRLLQKYRTREQTFREMTLELIQMQKEEFHKMGF